MTLAKVSFAAALVLIAGAGGAYWYLHRPVQQTSYYGVALSDGKSEVQYKLGVPPYVYGQRGTIYHVDGATTDIPALPDGRRFSDFDAWSYTPPIQCRRAFRRFL
jgi:hypothetical protein